jgi:hypothetical protein
MAKDRLLLPPKTLRISAPHGFPYFAKVMLFFVMKVAPGGQGPAPGLSTVLMNGCLCSSFRRLNGSVL